MALSEYERHQLDELERRLTDQDPDLAQDLGRRHLPRRPVITAIALALGAVVLVAGLVLTVGSLVLGIAVGALGALAIGVAAWRLVQDWQPIRPV